MAAISPKIEFAQTLYNLLDAGKTEEEERGSATRVRLALAAIGAAALASTLYGIGVGSPAFAQALENIVKLPLVIVLPLFFSWPIGALVTKFMGAPMRSSDLILAQAIGVFGASLLLAALAPVVALFYHTTATLGGFAATATGCTAGLVGLWLFFRSVLERSDRRSALVPAAVSAGIYGLASLQIIALASPILIETTRFADGVPGLF